jgi:hypothetical protein
MNQTDIQERISDILADIDDLATDSDLSTGEILLEVALGMIRECNGHDMNPEERKVAINQFLEAVRLKAVAA